MRTYFKIDTVFKRAEDGTHKLTREWCNPLVDYLKNNEWEFTEKIDGTNTPVHWDGHNITYGGRTEDAVVPEKVREALDEIFDEAEIQVIEQMFGEKEVTFYGEMYGGDISKKHKGVAYACKKESYILFDIQVGDVWLSRENVLDIGKKLGIDVVPTYMTGTLSYGVNVIERGVAEELHSLRGNRMIEGFVARPMVRVFDWKGRPVCVKIRVDDFHGKKYIEQSQHLYNEK